MLVIWLYLIILPPSLWCQNLPWTKLGYILREHCFSFKILFLGLGIDQTNWVWCSNDDREGVYQDCKFHEPRDRGSCNKSYFENASYSSPELYQPRRHRRVSDTQMTVTFNACAPLFLFTKECFVWKMVKVSRVVLKEEIMLKVNTYFVFVFHWK